jgi:hypothetical protein
MNSNAARFFLGTGILALSLLISSPWPRFPSNELSGIVTAPAGSVGPDAKIFRQESINGDPNQFSRSSGPSVATSQSAIQRNLSSATPRGALL